MTATNLVGEGHSSNDNHHNNHRFVNCVPSPRDSDASAEIPGNMSTSRHPRRRMTLGAAALVVLSTVLLPMAAAQTSSGRCISLASSRTCAAFNESSISTSSALTGEYPFLAYVSDTEQFDTQFEQYIKQDYAKNKYQSLFGCSNLTLSNTTDLYARFTRSVLCSRMIQDSRSACSLATAESTPICADSCAQFAISEQIIISNDATCGTSKDDALSLIRSDFTICALPSDSLTQNCISGDTNEPTNCGYSNNLPGLCLYCATNSPNSTDTCCYNSNAEQRCENVDLPTATSLPPIFTITATSSTTPESGSTNFNSGSGLSGGQIAGITIGALAGVALIAFLILFLRRRRRNYGSTAPAFNQPPRQHRSPSMTFNPVAAVGVQAQGYEVLTGGRIARMSALEGTNATTSEIDPSSPAMVGGVMRGHRVIDNSSSSDFGLEESPGSNNRRFSPHNRPLHPPPRDRNASLSSTSILMSENPTSPMTESDRDVSSPGFSGSQSEQLPYFKDYYSQDDIHPNDKVAVLWAYQPRAVDEFDLDRGDMLQVVGIWDDGWATGIRLNERAEDHINRRQLRDSGVSASQTSRASQRRTSSPPPGTEIKAFPLVCVCLPEHWQKTIDSDAQGSEYAGFSSDPPEEQMHGRLHDNDPRTPERKIAQKGSSRFREDLNVPRPGPSSSPPP